MEPKGTLPKFRRAPLIEVVHGVQFRPLPMTIVHPGLFYARVRDRYPNVQTVAPLPPVREIFEPAGSARMQLSFATQEELPRAWFVSADDTMLIQLQRERLLINWRKGAGDGEYPHFEKVSAEFQRVYADFAAFAKDQGLGAIEPDQCEMTYINHLHPPVPRSASPDPSTLLRVWAGSAGSEWPNPLEDLSFTARYLLTRNDGHPYGRMFTAVSTLVSPRLSEQILQLEITARGNPSSPDLLGVLDFHAKAHEQIVTCFAGITTETAHGKWERWQ